MLLHQASNDEQQRQQHADTYEDVILAEVAVLAVRKSSVGQRRGRAAGAAAAGLRARYHRSVLGACLMRAGRLPDCPRFQAL